MIDSHCHLNFHKFEKDVDVVIDRAVKSGIKAMINVGTQISSSKEVVLLAQKHQQIFASVGVHPHHADKVSENWLQELKSLTTEDKVVAIGECGMDFFSYQSNGIVDPSIQEEIFRKQIELATESKLPLQIHNRQAGKEVIRILSEYRKDFIDAPGVFHCFAGDKNILTLALEMGFYIGFDGNITYPGLAQGENTLLSDIALETPVDRILIETDSPYLTPVPYRGQRNEPKNAIIINEFIADIKQMTPEQLAQEVQKNFSTLFRLSLN